MFFSFICFFFSQCIVFLLMLWTLLLIYLPTITHTIYWSFFAHDQTYHSVVKWFFVQLQQFYGVDYIHCLSLSASVPCRMYALCFVFTSLIKDFLRRFFFCLFFSSFFFFILSSFFFLWLWSGCESFETVAIPKYRNGFSMLNDEEWVCLLNEIKSRDFHRMNDEMKSRMVLGQQQQVWIVNYSYF